MKRYIAALLLALMLAMPGLSETLPAGEEAVPGEVEEFELDAPDTAPEADPESTVKVAPMPTLEPGSINYPDDKVNFEGEIWVILTRRWGLTDFQAAGLMSSIFAESSFCPYNAQNRDGVDNRRNYRFSTGDGVGFGLCQWTSPGRKDALRRYAKEHGDANLVWDFDIQMGYMFEEMDVRALKAAQTLYDATEWAVLRYERPNQAYENSWPGRRYDIALQIFRNHTGKAYEEPESTFAVRAEDGSDAAEGMILSEEGALTVTGNYYWRLEKPVWLEVTCPELYQPEEWGECTCGYAGETPLKLRIIVPPLLPSGELRFTIYHDGRETVRVPFTYTGIDFISWLREKLDSYGQNSKLMLKYR